MLEMRVHSLGPEDSPEKGMATHSGILAWRILWTEEPGGLQSLGSQSQAWLIKHKLSILIQRLYSCDWWNSMHQSALHFLRLSSIPLYVTAALTDPFICCERGLSPP